MTTIEIAGLSTVVCAGPSETHVDSMVIMLHGYGAPGTDLTSLAGEMKVPRGTLMLFPAAPINLAHDQPDLGDTRAWWPIDMVRLQVAMMTGQFDQVAEGLRHGLPEAIACISGFVVAATEKFNVPLERVILGGFSQGAILCLETVLKNRWRLPGLVLFSTSLLEPRSTFERAGEIAPMACVLSHGQFDPILPYSRAEELRSGLSNAGWRVDWQPFLGGHGIHPKAVVATSTMISQQLSQQLL